MSVSQCTTFLLKNGKEEIRVCWDVSDGTIEIQRLTLCPPINHKPPKEQKKGSQEEINPHHQIIRVRYNDLEKCEAEEFLMAISKAFAVVYNLDIENDEDEDEGCSPNGSKWRSKDDEEESS
jgi:hypothetical protein